VLKTPKRPAFVVRRAFQVSELWFHSSHSTQRRSGKEHKFLAIGLQTYGCITVDKHLSSLIDLWCKCNEEFFNLSSTNVKNIFRNLLMIALNSILTRLSEIKKFSKKIFIH
jgi:hypothetical protein